MARTVRGSGEGSSTSEIKDDCLVFFEKPNTRDRHHAHGKPAGVLIGFESEDDWFEYRLEHDPRFLRRVEQARKNLRAGRGVRLEDIESE